MIKPYIAFALGPDVVWWDKEFTYVVGPDPRGIALYMNGDDVVYDNEPEDFDIHAFICVDPGLGRGKVTTEYQFRSALHMHALMLGEIIDPLPTTCASSVF